MNHPKTRVLVVDDAIVVRRLMTDLLNAEADIETVGVASDGKQALEKIDALKPDVVTLDVEMPVMDGLECLRALRAKHPKLPVVMFSTLTERGAVTTLDALAMGANDYVTKPANVGSVSAAGQKIREELIPKLRFFASRGRTASAAAPAPALPSAPRTVRPAGAQRIDLVVIGISTGGPVALAEMLPQFPADVPVPILIVQHMPPVFTKTLAERLDTSTKLRVREAQRGDAVEPGRILIAPGDYHLSVRASGGGWVVETSQDAHENSCRPAVDVLFRSAATAFGSHVLGVVMTGMGQDGLRGSEQLVAAGSAVVVQDEGSSVVWGMPGAVAKAGLASGVFPLGSLAREVCDRVRASRAAFPVSAK